jgi:DNA-binding NtrC family response regulator
MTVSILVVDDDPVQRRLLEAAVVRMGHAAQTVDSGEAALAVLDGAGGGSINLVILDLIMPGLSGLDVLAAMRERAITLPVIVQTAQGGIDVVIGAMRAGAFDFVVKPVAAERLQLSIANALKLEAVETTIKRSARSKVAPGGFEDLVTASPEMERVIRLGRKAAQSNIPILIEGESGVGKEVVARAIQATSIRKSKPFITVNCGAIPDNLVESILFGHEKGAFTGAADKHTGKFVEAHGGTLFLDEIGDLPLDVQVKLLRAVQEGEVDPVGAKAPRKVDIRLISATHRDLLQKVKDGTFREDLYYRLNVFPIMVPALRYRKSDIPRLVQHFVRKFAAEHGAGEITVSPGAMALLQAFDWPGNIRQLENAVFRAVVLCDSGQLSADEFPQIRAQVDGIPEIGSEVASVVPDDNNDETRRLPGVSGAQERATDIPFERLQVEPPSLNYGTVPALGEDGHVRSLASLEEEMIRFAIEHYEGQMSRVARKLGIGRSTLYRKLKEYGIDVGESESETLAADD